MQTIWWICGKKLSFLQEYLHAPRWSLIAWLVFVIFNGQPVEIMNCSTNPICTCCISWRNCRWLPRPTKMNKIPYVYVKGLISSFINRCIRKSAFFSFIFFLIFLFVFLFSFFFFLFCFVFMIWQENVCRYNVPEKIQRTTPLYASWSTNHTVVLLYTIHLHRDHLKMHPFCLGLYFKNWWIKMKNYFIITIRRVLSILGLILSKIRLGVLEKSRIL